MYIPPDEPAKPDHRATYAGLALIVLAALLVRLPLLLGGFFADDYFFLERVRGKGLLAALASPDPLGNFLRPVSRQLYFWAVGSASGETPAAFHAVNLLLFACLLLLLFRLVRRLADAPLALVAAAYVGFHYAADVPLLWASGSQDLLAVAFALLALDLHLAGRLAPALLALLVALLSKESVALTPAIALLLSWRESGDLRAAARKSAGLFAVTAAWALAWILTLGERPAGAAALSLGPGAIPAVLAHLVQAALGLEFRLGGSALGHFGLGALTTGAAAAAICWLVTGRRTEPSGEKPTPHPARTPSLAWIGGAWAVCGALPVALVAPIWSAYFYLFALCGVALLLAALLASQTRTTRSAAVGVLALLSAGASALDEFSTSRTAWSWQSHVNRHYVARATGTIESYLSTLKWARPALPPRSTVFFANVPVSLGWQAGDGPLLRWAYRDSTLRSYFLTEFTRARAARGPMYFFAVEGGALVDHTDDPMLLASFAYSMLLSDRARAAADVLDLAIARDPDDRTLHYWRAWARWASGDSAGAKEDLKRAGVRAERRVSAAARRAFDAGGSDTSRTIARLMAARDSAGLDPWVHARLAAFCLGPGGQREDGVVEAFAFRALDPSDPDAWRKWASAQLAERKHEAALRSLETYMRLAGREAAADREARQAIHLLREMVAGRIAQSAVRE